MDGALIEFLRVLYYNPEILLWERYWVERNKDMDRELYGIVKWCNSDLKFGLNVWNRNHFNPLRKAQWPWAEMADVERLGQADHLPAPGGRHLRRRDGRARTSRSCATGRRRNSRRSCTSSWACNEAPWDELVRTGMDPDTYVYGQCADAVPGVDGKVDVYMGIGVDAPRSRADQAVCTPDIVRRSVLATYRAGGKGVVFSPAYAGMNLATLDGAAQALKELGLLTA